jgi:hypothetical protein
MKAAQELKWVQQIDEQFSVTIKKLLKSRFGETHDKFRNQILEQRCAQIRQIRAKMVDGGFQLVKPKKNKGKLDHVEIEETEKLHLKLRDPWKIWWNSFCLLRRPALLKEQERWSKAREKQEHKLGRLRLEVHNKLIAGAKAILCTVDMVHAIPAKLKQLFEFFPIFRSKIAVAIIDEAGSIPEHKLPTIVSIGVRCAFLCE